MTTKIIILVFIAILGFVLTPFVMAIAKKYGFIDKPNYRKIHKSEIPRLGGLAIYLSFTVGILLLFFTTDIFVQKQNLFYSLLIGGTLIAIIGILDDKIELSAKQKLLGQVIAASVVLLFGVKASYISNPIGDGMLSLGLLSIPLTIIWIISITNAINLIDGLDGLAGGLSGIAAVSISIIAFLSGRSEEGILSLLLVSSVIGFLIFNFHPAKIFMGDVGSLYLGFILSVLTIQELKQITLFGVMVPLLLLAIPILDTLYAIIRRKMNKRPIFQPDKNHLHHRLISNGFSHRKAVLAIYVISSSFSILGVMLPYLDLLVIIILVVVLLVFFQIIAKDIGMIKGND